MLRKVLPLMLLMIFVWSNSALGWGHWRCCRRVCCCDHLSLAGPSYCLQDIYMDFPPTQPPAGDLPDLYFCLTYDYGCESHPDSPYEDLYYGNPPHYDLPQSCPAAGGHGCESDQSKCHYLSGEGAGPKGHGHNFTSKTDASDFLTGNSGAAGGQQCKYYELLKKDSGLKKDYFFVMVRVDTKRGPRYFGVETAALQDTSERAIFSNCKILHEQGNGKVLSFSVADSGPTCGGLVWLE